MIRRNVVTDASVVLEWLFPSESGFAAQAALLLEDITLGARRAWVPAIFWYEALNRVSRADKAETALSVLQRFIVRTLPPNFGRLARMLDWIRREQRRGNKKATSYDMAYIEAAQMLSATLVSADDLQLKMAERAGVQAVHVRDYRAGTA